MTQLVQVSVLPQGAIEHSSFFDEEGEAVRAKAREEAQEDRELAGMMVHDKPSVAIEAPRPVTFAEAVETVETQISDDEQATGFDNAPEAMVVSQVEPGVPVAFPPVLSSSSSSTAQPVTPRMSHPTRAHDDAPDEHEAKTSRVETQKKQRVEHLAAEYTNMIRTVKVADDEFFTMDEYDTDLQLEESFDPTDPWWDANNVKLDGMPDELWARGSLNNNGRDMVKAGSSASWQKQLPGSYSSWALSLAWSLVQRFLEMMEISANLVLRRMTLVMNISGFTFGCWCWFYYGLACWLLQ